MKSIGLSTGPIACRGRKPRQLDNAAPHVRAPSACKAVVKCTCHQATIEPIALSSKDGVELQGDFFDWNYGSRIHYIASGQQGPPILLVHGFGVGGFHFKENIAELSKDHRLWAIDLLGQGRSWPSQNGGYPEDLALSIDTWTEQLYDFINDVIKEPVILMGNSLGGYLAVSLASKHPELARGLVLLNATPFWGFAPSPGKRTILSNVLPYDGTLPAPEGVKALVGGLWWSRLTNPGNIQTLLNLVYSRPIRDKDLLDRIVEATEHPIALDAFVSIVFAPQADLEFNEMLDRIECQVCMIYGKDDPWVIPLWGKRLKRRVPQAMYYEITPAGHCPHHERPRSVNKVVAQWTLAMESGTLPAHQVGDVWEEALEDGTIVTTTVVDGTPRTIVEVFDVFMESLRKFVARYT